MAAPSPEAFPFPTAAQHDAVNVPSAPDRATDADPAIEQPSESALDHGVEESFPASDPVSVTVSRVAPRPTPPAGQAKDAAAAASKARWSAALRTGLIAGAWASVLSTAALMHVGRRETGSAFAPTNATSHWLWGAESLRADHPTLRHTAVGYVTHHLAATFWATLHAWWFGNRPDAQSAPAALAGAAVASAISCAVDYTVTPRSLRPGFEHRLSRPALGVMYAAFALGLAAGCLAANRRR